MIKDKIENLDRYIINDGFEELKKGILNNINDFKLPLKSIPLEYYTMSSDDVKFENHRQNIDIHYVIQGQENIGLNITDNLSPLMNFDIDSDYQLFKGAYDELIQLREGEFLILFPGEVHATGIMADEINFVKKIVFKVPLF